MATYAAVTLLGLLLFYFIAFVVRKIRRKYIAPRFMVLRLLCVLGTAALMLVLNEVAHFVPLPAWAHQAAIKLAAKKIPVPEECIPITRGLRAGITYWRARAKADADRAHPLGRSLTRWAAAQTRLAGHPPNHPFL